MEPEGIDPLSPRDSTKILVVEEKRPLLEEQLRSILYSRARHRSARVIVGKTRRDWPAAPARNRRA